MKEDDVAMFGAKARKIAKTCRCPDGAMNFAARRSLTDPPPPTRAPSPMPITATSPSTPSSQVTSDYQQWLRVPVSGFLLHPGVLRYAVAVRPLFGQHSTGALGQSTRARSLGLDASVALFQARRLNLTFQATNSSGMSRGDFGSRNQYDNTDFTAIAFVRDRYFPTTITYTDRSLRQQMNPVASAQISAMVAWAASPQKRSAQAPTTTATAMIGNSAAWK